LQNFLPFFVMQILRTFPALSTLRRVALMLCALGAGSATSLSAEVSRYGRQIIAAVLVLEAANQGEQGMAAVLHVINNRAKGDPSRAVGQVARREAFSCINTITSQKHPDYGPAIERAMNDRTWPRALAMVDAYCAGRLGHDNTGGATHYCIDPPRSWREQMVFTKRIGLHTFFREE
jgi:spore germination cell wall hydrolase CwlJ-like protein